MPYGFSPAHEPVLGARNLCRFSVRWLTVIEAALLVVIPAAWSRGDFGRGVDGMLRVSATPPQMLPVITANGSFAIRFPTGLGPTYVLEATVSLKPPSTWTVVAPLAGTGGTEALIVPVQPATPQRFFPVLQYR